jgi:squalene-hopene/tetraprenyl-beta-curcumene cyclase
MQNHDGGWAAFDRNCDKKLLTYIPFADHNAMIDPSTADVTARTIEALRQNGMPRDAPEIVRAVDFLRREQEPDGSWYGRWGCNYIYGTWLGLCALASIGESAFASAFDSDAPSPSCRQAVDWLLSVQNPDGGWGETLGSYDDPSLKGCGESTAAQTSWAAMGLMAGSGWRDDRLVSTAVERGIGFLHDRQLADGSWIDGPWTGTGFPSVFYLRYYGYALYFPLQALATFRRQA